MFKRTFVAIKINPTEELLRRIYYLKRNLESSNINWVNENNLHITLRFIGQTPQELINDISKDLEYELSTQKSFHIDISGISIFGSKHQPKVVWAGAKPKEKLLELSQKADEILIKYGFTRDRQNFVPHLSLGRIKKLKDIHHFQKVLDRIKDGLIQSEMINEIVFYESILKSRGAVYNPIKIIKLSR